MYLPLSKMGLTFYYSKEMKEKLEQAAEGGELLIKPERTREPRESSSITIGFAQVKPGKCFSNF